VGEREDGGSKYEGESMRAREKNRKKNGRKDKGLQGKSE